MTVGYATADGTAQAGVDYMAVLPSTLTFPAGQTEETITVQVNAEPANGRTRPSR